MPTVGEVSVNFNTVLDDFNRGIKEAQNKIDGLVKHASKTIIKVSFDDDISRILDNLAKDVSYIADLFKKLSTVFSDVFSTVGDFFKNLNSETDGFIKAFSRKVTGVTFVRFKNLFSGGFAKTLLIITLAFVLVAKSLKNFLFILDKVTASGLSFDNVYSLISRKFQNHLSPIFDSSIGKLGIFSKKTDEVGRVGLFSKLGMSISAIVEVFKKFGSIVLAVEKVVHLFRFGFLSLINVFGFGRPLATVYNLALLKVGVAFGSTKAKVFDTMRQFVLYSQTLKAHFAIQEKIREQTQATAKSIKRFSNTLEKGKTFQKAKLPLTLQFAEFRTFLERTLIIVIPLLARMASSLTLLLQIISEVLGVTIRSKKELTEVEEGVNKVAKVFTKSDVYRDVITQVGSEVTKIGKTFRQTRNLSKGFFDSLLPMQQHVERLYSFKKAVLFLLAFPFKFAWWGIKFTFVTYYELIREGYIRSIRVIKKMNKEIKEAFKILGPLIVPALKKAGIYVYDAFIWIGEKWFTFVTPIIAKINDKIKVLKEALIAGIKRVAVATKKVAIAGAKKVDSFIVFMGRGLAIKIERFGAFVGKGIVKLYKVIKASIRPIITFLTSERIADAIFSMLISLGQNITFYTKLIFYKVTKILSISFRYLRDSFHFLVLKITGIFFQLKMRIEIIVLSIASFLLQLPSYIKRASIATYEWLVSVSTWIPKAINAVKNGMVKIGEVVKKTWTVFRALNPYRWKFELGWAWFSAAAITAIHRIPIAYKYLGKTIPQLTKALVTISAHIWRFGIDKMGKLFGSLNPVVKKVFKGIGLVIGMFSASLLIPLWPVKKLLQGVGFSFSFLHKLFTKAPEPKILKSLSHTQKVEFNLKKITKLFEDLTKSLNLTSLLDTIKLLTDALTKLNTTLTGLSTGGFAGLSKGTKKGVDSLLSVSEGVKKSGSSLTRYSQQAFDILRPFLSGTTDQLLAAKKGTESFNVAIGNLAGRELGKLFSAKGTEGFKLFIDSLKSIPGIDTTTLTKISEGFEGIRNKIAGMGRGGIKKFIAENSDEIGKMSLYLKTTFSDLMPEISKSFENGKIAPKIFVKALKKAFEEGKIGVEDFTKILSTAFGHLLPETLKPTTQTIQNLKTTIQTIPSKINTFTPLINDAITAKKTVEETVNEIKKIAPFTKKGKIFQLPKKIVEKETLEKEKKLAQEVTEKVELLGNTFIGVQQKIGATTKIFKEFRDGFNNIIPGQFNPLIQMEKEAPKSIEKIREAIEKVNGAMNRAKEAMAIKAPTQGIVEIKKLKEVVEAPPKKSFFESFIDTVKRGSNWIKGGIQRVLGVEKVNGAMDQAGEAVKRWDEKMRKAYAPFTRIKKALAEMKFPTQGIIGIEKLNEATDRVKKLSEALGQVRKAMAIKFPTQGIEEVKKLGEGIKELGVKTKTVGENKNLDKLWEAMRKMRELDASKKTPQPAFLSKLEGIDVLLSKTRQLALVPAQFALITKQFAIVPTQFALIINQLAALPIQINRVNIQIFNFIRVLILAYQQINQLALKGGQGLSGTEGKLIPISNQMKRISDNTNTALVPFKQFTNTIEGSLIPFKQLKEETIKWADITIKSTQALPKIAEASTPYHAMREEIVLTEKQIKRFAEAFLTLITSLTTARIPKIFAEFETGKGGRELNKTKTNYIETIRGMVQEFKKGKGPILQFITLLKKIGDGEGEVKRLHSALLKYFGKDMLSYTAFDIFKVKEMRENTLKEIEKLLPEIAKKLEVKLGGKKKGGILKNLIEEIESGRLTLEKALILLLNIFKDYLPQSPVKKGPLRSIVKSGQKVVELFTSGMNQGNKILDKASGKMAKTIKAYLPSSPAEKGPLRGLVKSGIATAALYATGIGIGMPLIVQALIGLSAGVFALIAIKKVGDAFANAIVTPLQGLPSKVWALGEKIGSTLLSAIKLPFEAFSFFSFFTDKLTNLKSSIENALFKNVFTELVKEITALDGSLYLVSQRLGISTESLSFLGYAAEQAGTDAGQIIYPLSRMTEQISKALGNLEGDGAKKLQGLGFDLQAISKSAEPAITAFYQLADILEKAGAGTPKFQKTLSEMGIMLNSDIVNVLMQGSTEIKKLAKEVGNLNIVVDEAQTDNVLKITAVLVDLKAALMGVKRLIVIEIFPYVHSYLKEIVDFIKDNQLKIRVYIIVIGNVLRKVLDYLSNSLKLLFTNPEELFKRFTLLTDILLRTIIELAKSVIKVVLPLFSGLFDLVDSLITRQLKLTIVFIISEVVKMIIKLSALAHTFFFNHLPKIVKQGFITSISKAIWGAVSWVADIMVNIRKKMADWLLPPLLKEQFGSLEKVMQSRAGASFIQAKAPAAFVAYQAVKDMENAGNAFKKYANEQVTNLVLLENDVDDTAKFFLGAIKEHSKSLDHINAMVHELVLGEKYDDQSINIKETIKLIKNLKDTQAKFKEELKGYQEGNPYVDTPKKKEYREKILHYEKLIAEQEDRLKDASESRTLADQERRLKAFQQAMASFKSVGTTLLADTNKNLITLKEELIKASKDLGIGHVIKEIQFATSREEIIRITKEIEEKTNKQIKKIESAFSKIQKGFNSQTLVTIQALSKELKKITDEIIKETNDSLLGVYNSTDAFLKKTVKAALIGTGKLDLLGISSPEAVLQKQIKEAGLLKQPYIKAFKEIEEKYKEVRDKLIVSSIEIQTEITKGLLQGQDVSGLLKGWSEVQEKLVDISITMTDIKEKTNLKVFFEQNSAAITTMIEVEKALKSESEQNRDILTQRKEEIEQAVAMLRTLNLAPGVKEDLLNKFKKAREDINYEEVKKQQEMIKEFMTTVSGHVKTLFSEFVKTGKTSLETVANIGQDLLQKGLEQATGFLTEKLTGAMTGLLGDIGVGGKFTSGILGGIGAIAGLLMSKVKSEVEVVNKGVESAVEQTKQLRGVVAGETQIGIFEVGESFKNVNAPVVSELLGIKYVLYDIRAILSKGNGLDTSYLASRT